MDRRTARYRCVLAAARDGEILLTAEGAVEGLILEAPHGTGGFGYDPLFYLPNLDQTMADLLDYWRDRVRVLGMQPVSTR